MNYWISGKRIFVLLAALVLLISVTGARRIRRCKAEIGKVFRNGFDADLFCNGLIEKCGYPQKNREYY